MARHLFLRHAAVLALGAIVAASACLRALVAWLRDTPLYVPDEYIYAELGRSLAETGQPLVRGGAAHFPALLQPLLTAPAWLVDDIELAYRIVQSVGAVAMSLAAVPVYVLARRLGLGRPVSLGVAALAVALPDLLYASFVVAEPIAYPLVLGAVAAGTYALAKPTWRSQGAFVVLSALAVSARVQFVVLPLCFAVAALVAGGRERRIRSVLREQYAVFGVFALLALTALAVAGRDALGVYGGAGSSLDLVELQQAALNLLVFVYASGWILVPGAVLGGVLALARPRSRAELGFASLSLPLASLLLVQATVVGEVDRAQERYLFYAAPLATLCFALYASRGWPLRRVHFALAAGLIAVAARFPLSGFAAGDGKEHSPFLIATAQLERSLGSAGSGSLAIALAAAVLSLAVAAASLRPRFGAAVAVSLAVAAAGAAWAGAAVFDSRYSAEVRRSYLPPDLSWIDDAQLRDVALLRAPGALTTDSMQLFWNRSVRRVLLLPGAVAPDQFGGEPVRIARDGSLVSGGRAFEGALLVGNATATVQLQEAEPVRRTAAYALWRPEGRPRLSLYLLGRFQDGWLSSEGRLMLWPRAGTTELAGVVTMRLDLPAGLRATTLNVRARRRVTQSFAVEPGGATVARIRVCSTGPWSANLTAPPTSIIGGRFLSVHTSEPRFRPDPAVCRGAV